MPEVFYTQVRYFDFTSSTDYFDFTSQFSNFHIFYTLFLIATPSDSLLTKEEAPLP